MSTVLHGHVKNLDNGHKWKSPTYTCWQNMKARCLRHERYAGIGITLCERWYDFRNFLADMGEKPEGKTLDRTDNDAGYSPENCRWADIYTQNQNTSVKGVGFDRQAGKWRARTQRFGKQYFVGHFDTEAEAIKARLEFIKNNFS
jgi:hypothetical protein